MRPTIAQSYGKLISQLARGPFVREDNLQVPTFEIGSTPWYLWVSKTKAVEVEVVLAPLQGVDGDHLTSAVGAGAHHVR